MRKKMTLLTVILLLITMSACRAAGEEPSDTVAKTEEISAEAEETTAAGTEENNSAAAEEEYSAETTAAGSETAADMLSENAVIFETTDLSGNPVTAEDLFTEHTLTMVNIWGTFCPPCIREMPDLEILNQRLQEKDIAIVGIVCDVMGPEDQEHIDLAFEIMDATGVTYQSILPWDGWEVQFPAQFVPTTYFVNEKGEIVGTPAIGARGADEYEALIDEVLKNL